jgi:hypothetical protein
MAGKKVCRGARRDRRDKIKMPKNDILKSVVGLIIETRPPFSTLFPCGYEMKRIFLIFVVFIVCAIHVCFVSGCRFAHVVSSNTNLNTFTISEKWLSGSIYSVTVYHKNPHEELSKIVWKIEAISDIRLSGFTVIVGNVPDGFKQIIPSPPEKFHPTKGERYLIDIVGRTDVDIVGLNWIAQ